MPETITLWNQDESEEMLSEYNNIDNNNNRKNDNERNNKNNKSKRKLEDNVFGENIDGRYIVNKDAPPPPR